VKSAGGTGQSGRVVDPIGRFRASIERTSAKTDRSNDFLERSREAVQRGVDRIDRLRPTVRDHHATHDSEQASGEG
jgi:hypothetical protein